MVVKGIDLTIETGLQGDFQEVLDNVTKTNCHFSVDFSAANNRIRRALASGTQVEAYLGYNDDTAAEVVRDPQFTSTFEQSLRVVSEEFEEVVVTDFNVEFITTSTTTVIKATLKAVMTTDSIKAAIKDDDSDSSAPLPIYMYIIITLAAGGGLIIIIVTIIVICSCTKSERNKDVETASFKS